MHRYVQPVSSPVICQCHHGIGAHRAFVKWPLERPLSSSSASIARGALIGLSSVYATFL